MEWSSKGFVGFNLRPLNGDGGGKGVQVHQVDERGSHLKEEALHESMIRGTLL